MCVLFRTSFEIIYGTLWSSLETWVLVVDEVWPFLTQTNLRKSNQTQIKYSQFKLKKKLAKWEIPKKVCKLYIVNKFSYTL